MRCHIPIFKAAACFLAAFALCRPVHALSFNITYDASVSNRSDYAQIVTAINYTALEFSSLFTNPITVNILVQADPTISGGESTENYMPTTYSAVRSALIAHATSPDDVTADASLPVTDPTGFAVSKAGIPQTSVEARALEHVDRLHLAGHPEAKHKGKLGRQRVSAQTAQLR